MKLIISEGDLNWVEWLHYRGVIGLFYSSTWEGLLAYAIIAVICVLALIGLLTVIRWIISGIQKGNKKNKDPYSEWLKTGKF